jgi:hypothetical protein
MLAEKLGGMRETRMRGNAKHGCMEHEEKKKVSAFDLNLASSKK